MDWSFSEATDAVQLVGMIALGAYTYLGDRDKVSAAGLVKLEADITVRNERYEERLRLLETNLGKQPTHRDIAALYESLNTLASTVNQLVGETKLQSDLLRMLINREVQRKEGS